MMSLFGYLEIPEFLRLLRSHTATHLYLGRADKEVTQQQCL